MEKEQEKHEWKLLFIFLVFSLVISVVAIFQLLYKVAELEVKVIEQDRVLATQQKTIADDKLRNKMFGGVGG